MREIKQSTTANVMVFMADSGDHVTGKTGLTLTITASKNGAAFGSITPDVTERGNGWYNLAITAAHSNTLGDLCLHITGAGADPSDLKLLVVEYILDAPVSSRATRSELIDITPSLTAEFKAITAVKGTQVVKNYQLLDGGKPRPLSGYTVKAAAKARISDTTYKIEPFDADITDEENGEITITWDIPDETFDGVYEVLLIDGSNNRTLLTVPRGKQFLVVENIID